jgi:heme/copper-type cytochrome/quinol oxidase subunit 4
VTPSLFFLLALSCLLAHEMDAVRRHEWQIFPLLDRIADDGRGYAVFTALHIPLYALIFWALVPDGATLNLGAVVALDAFCLVHVLLHLLFLHHPRSQFNNPFSWALILGAGIAGGIDLLLRM